MQQQVTQTGSFTTATKDAIQANFNALFGGLLQVGTVYYCQPDASPTGVQTGAQDKPFTTLAGAYNACASGLNDVVVLVGNGGTSATARVESAFTWSKNATHLLGICSPVLISQRARIAPTGSTTAFTPFFTVSGNGCVFQNIQWYYGFDTGVASAILMPLTGSRNYFKNCQLAGMADDASAQSTGSRCLKIGAAGSGENVFDSCTIGLDTVTRTVANASLEFTAATTRNVFRNCLFPFMTSAATVLGIIGSGTENMDRFQVFDNCLFINGIKSTSTTMTALATLAASSGGLLLFKQCVLVGITDYGSDATTLALCYIDGLTGAAATSGIAVNPS